MTEPVYFSTVTSLRSAILRKCITFNHTHKLTDYTFNHIQMLLWEIVNIVSKVLKNLVRRAHFSDRRDQITISSRLLIGRSIKVNIVSKEQQKKKSKSMKASFEHKYIEQKREQRMERIKQTANNCYINLLVRFINLRCSLKM